MSRYPRPVLALLLGLAATPLWAADREVRTVRSAADAVRGLVFTLPRIVPPEQVRDAAGVIIVPQMLRGGLVLGGRFGRGVALARQPDRSWGQPVFVTVSGGSVGGQVGIEAIDVVLVFRTAQALERALAGSFTLDGDASVAIGPLAGEAEQGIAAGWPRAEVVCYPRSRGGLFAGLALEGAWLAVDARGNEEFARLRTLEKSVAYQGLVQELTRLATPFAVAPASGKARTTGGRPTSSSARPR